MTVGSRLQQGYRLGAIALLACTLFFGTRTVLGFGDGLLFATAIVMLALVVPAALQPNRELGSWDLVVAAAIPAVLLRGAFIHWSYPSNEELRAFARPEDPSDYAWPGLQLAVGLFAFGLAFTATARSREQPRPPFMSFRLPPTVAGIKRTGLILAGIGMLMFVLFVRSTGGLDLTNFSAKRAVFLDAETAGYQNFFRFGSTATFWGALIYISGMRTPLNRRSVPIAGLVLLAALLPAFYSSSRGDLIGIALGVVVLLSRSGRRLRFGPLLLGVGAVLLIVASVTSLRAERVDSLDLGGPGEVLQSLVLNRNFTYPGKHLVVWDIYQGGGGRDGATYIAALAAPVPRTIWASKPQVHPGPTLAFEGYGQERSGVPPGGISELVWNFGLVGLLFAAPMGAAFGLLERTLLERVANGLVLYAGLFMQLPARYVGAGFSYASVGKLTEVAILLVLAVIAGARIRFYRLSR